MSNEETASFSEARVARANTEREADLRYVTDPVEGSEKSTSRPIEMLIHEIRVRADKSDDHLIAAALLFRELRSRIEAGEVGEGIKWMAWMRKHVKLSETRLYELMTIADAENPRKEMERIRKINRERQKAYRDEQKKKRAEAANLEQERLDLIKWAKEAHLDSVRRILIATKEVAAETDVSAASETVH